MSAPRFRQSYGKTLLSECAALCWKQVQNDVRNPTRAMQRGSLVDYLAFGQDARYEIVDARYKSGEREGQPAEDYAGKDARAQRDEILSRGLTPALPHEIEALTPTALAIRERLQALALDMAGGFGGYRFDVVFQPHMEWTSELGVECSGTPDVVVLVFMRDLIKVCTIDVKHTAFMQTKRFNRQVRAMGWDMQGATYAEGSKAWAESEHGMPAFHFEHVILATSSVEQGLPPCARRLDATYMALGRKFWKKAQEQWQACLDSSSWPGYSEEAATPSHYDVRTLEEYDPSTFAAEVADEEIEP